MIVECRPDGVAVSSSQQLSGGSAVFVPPALEVEAMDADGPTIDSPAIPSSSAPVVEVIPEGDVPHSAGDQPSAPVLKDAGCQTVVGMCPSVATQTSTVHLPRTVLSSEGRTGGRFPCVMRICSMHSSLLVTPVQGLAAVPLAGNLCSMTVFRSPGLRNSLGTNSPLNWMPVMFSWLSPFREFLLCVLTQWGRL